MLTIISNFFVFVSFTRTGISNSTTQVHPRVSDQGHPLAGRSSGHGLSRGKEFAFLSLLINSSGFDRLGYASLFSIGRCRIGPHQSPIRIKTWGEVSKKISSPPLAIIVAPENCRYHAVSKVIGFTDPLAHPVRGPTQLWLTAWAYHLIKSSPSCLYFRDGTAANQTLWL